MRHSHTEAAFSSYVRWFVRNGYGNESAADSVVVATPASSVDLTNMHGETENSINIRALKCYESDTFGVQLLRVNVLALQFQAKTSWLRVNIFFGSNDFFVSLFLMRVKLTNATSKIQVLIW